MSTKHTPIPWKVSAGKVYIHSEKVRICKMELGCQSEKEAWANAAIIVQAVNNHAALVLALEAAERALTACAGWQTKDGKSRADMANHWAADARAAIDKAKVEA